MVIMWINSSGNLYLGDCILGDREATPAEVSAYEATKERARLDGITVSKWQLVRALNDMNLRAIVLGAINSADQSTQDAWTFSVEFRRDHPLVLGLGQALGKSSDDLDALFLLASTK